MKKIIELLNTIEPAGTFSAKKTADSSHLKIRINEAEAGERNLKFPVSADAARALIKVATPAKYGWKDQTLYDPRVRNGWEIPGSRLKINSRVWHTMLVSMLDEFKSELGLPQESQLSARLHNLLIYEKDQFFSPHQDSEKFDGMIASLVVVLPSEFSGGDSVINHHDVRKCYKSSDFSRENLTLILFYADCPHEVTPVTEGYRLALTFNVILEKTAEARLPSPDHVQLVAELGAALGAHFDSSPQDDSGSAIYIVPTRVRPRVRKWVYLLDHQYTQGSLRWNRLKNEDQKRVDALRLAASQLDLEAHLALTDVQEVWDCENGHDDWELSLGRNRWHLDDDDIESDNNSDDEPIARARIDSSVHLTYSLDEQNQPTDAAGLYLDYREICWTKSTDQFDPFKSEYEGYMGNYGNTLDRWYHRAALILWRREDRIAVLCEINPNTAISELHRLLNNNVALHEVHEQVSAMLPYWQPKASCSTDPNLAANAFELAAKLNSADTAHALLLPLMIHSLLPDTAGAFIELQKTYGDDWCLALLKNWSESSRHAGDSLLEQFGELIEALIVKATRNNVLLPWLFDYQFKHIVKENIRCQQSESVNAAKRQAQFMSQLMQASNCIADVTVNGAVINYLIEETELFSIVELAIMTTEVHQRLGGAAFSKLGYSRLLDYTLERLTARVNKGLQASDDWTIERRSRCPCDDCLPLNQFLSSRKERMLVWPLRKDRRAHIHQVVDRLALPIKHETRRQGSPQKLVLTKTDELFVQDRQVLEEARRHAAILESLEC